MTARQSEFDVAAACGGPEPGVEFVDSIEQIQRQGSACQVDAQVALQANDHASPTQALYRKNPGAAAGAARLQYPLVNQVADKIRLDGAAPAEFLDSKRRSLVDYFDARLNYVVFVSHRITTLPSVRAD